MAATAKNTRRTASREQRRQQLIDATMKCIARKGMSSTSIGDVAKTAGLSQGIINLHFNSKDNLLNETLRHLADEYKATFNKTLENSGPGAADKLIALAFRENRLKNRDLWDMAWLTQRGVELPTDLIPKKIRDHGRDGDEFRNCLSDRVEHLGTDEARANFLNEMRRFLPSATVEETLQQEGYWEWLRRVVVEQAQLVG